jgi:hypothetical protein
MSQLSDPELLKMAVTESTKILPYVISSRKTIKLYLKVTSTCFSPFTLQSLMLASGVLGHVVLSRR